MKASLPRQVMPELKAKNGGSMPPFFMAARFARLQQPDPNKKGRLSVLFHLADGCYQPGCASPDCAAPASTAFIDSRNRPLSSASSTFTFTDWPSLR